MATNTEIDSSLLAKENERLAAENELLKAIINKIDTPVVAAEKSGKVVLVNEAAATRFGEEFINKTKEEWLQGLEVYSAASKIPLPFDELPLLQALQNKHTVQKHLYIKLPNRNPEYITVEGAPLLNKFGKHIGGMISFNLLNETIQTEEKLRQSEWNYKTLVERIDDGVLYVDNDDVVQFANPKFCENLGYTLQEILGKKAKEFFLADKKSVRLAKQVDELRNKGVANRYQIKIKDKQGNLRDFEVSGSPITDANGNKIGTMGIHIDITERVTALEKIIESETRYRTLVENMSEGLVIVDKNSTIQFVNQRFYKLSETKNNSLLGNNFLEALDFQNLSKKELLAKFKKRLKGQSERYEICIKTPKGSIKWLSVNASPMYDAHKNIVGSMGAYTDITETRIMEREKAMLSSVVNSATDFVAIANKHGETIYLNEACRKVLGIPLSKPLAQINWQNYYTQQSLARLKEEIIPEVYKNGIWNGELTINSSKGKEMAVSHVMVCKKDAHGAIEYIATIARDITEIKNAQREIALLARMPDETPAPIMRIANDATIAYANKASQLLLTQWKTEQGKKLPAVWAKLIGRVLLSGKSKEYEVDCGRRIFDLRLIPVKDFDYVNIIGSDVTHKKKSEKQLIASEKKYRAVVEDQTELISRYLGDGTITFANNAYCRYFGVEPEAVVGSKIFKNMPSVSKRKFLNRLALLNIDNPVISYNQEITKAGVPIKWQMWTDRAIFDDNGIFIEYQSVGRDITELKEAEAEVKSRELFLRQIIDTIPSLIYVRNLNGQYQLGNKAFADFVGKKVDKINEQKTTDLFGTTNGQKYWQEDNKILETGSTQIFADDKVIDKKGNPRWFQTIKTPLLVPNQKQQQILGVSIDITEQKQIEDALRFQLEFKELIASISTKFINVSFNEVDQEIELSLQQIGGFIDADRVALILIEGERLVRKYNWYSTLGLKTKGKEHDITVPEFQWEINAIKQKGLLYYSDTKDIPKEAKLLKASVSQFGVKTTMLMPLQSRNVLFGYLRISIIKEHKHFGNDSMALLSIAAQIFSGALERKRTEEMLNFRVVFENAITNISANFINIPPVNIDGEINEALRYVSNFMNVERSYILSSGKNNKAFNLSHSWAKDNMSNPTMAGNIYDAKDFPWFQKELSSSGILLVASSKELPREAKSIKTLMFLEGLESVICVPIKYGGQFSGILVFASTTRERFWLDEAIPLLKLLAQVFANALERKQAEESLTETKEMYRTLASNIPNASVMLFDQDLRYRIVEGAALEQHGYYKKSIEGKTIYEVLPTTIRKNLEPLYRDALNGKEHVFEREYSKRHYLIHILPVTNDAGDIYAGMVMSLDISDLKQVQKKLEEQTKVLIRSNEDLEQFAYAASHDLQEPLRMISSYVNLIERRIGNQLSGDVQEFMNFATDGVRRMQQLINDLLEYSRVDRKGNTFKEVDMNKILEFVKLNLKGAIETTQAEVVYKQMPIITADQPQMISLFQNLMENALKFTGKEQPKIEINAKEYKHKYRFTFKDNGIGIDNKYFERIFIIFQRLNSRNDYTGTGIGLAICKKIVERHGGRIWLSSAPGRGTTFYFEVAK